MAVAAVLASFGTVSVTNQAGVVLTGELTSVTNGRFTVNGRTMPLTVLRPSERMRVMRLAGCDVRSPAERRDAQRVALELKGVDERLKAGLLTSEEAEERRRRILAAAEFRRTQVAAKTADKSVPLSNVTNIRYNTRSNQPRY